MTKYTFRKSKFETLGEGMVNYCDKDGLFFSRGKSIFKRDRDGKITKIISLYLNSPDLLLSKSKLYRRLTRSHINHILPVQDDHLLVFVSGKIYYINIKKEEIVYSCDIQGSQPIHIASIGDTVYYGQYLRDPNKPPIKLLCSSPPYSSWTPVKIFDDIRHIHGVFRDPYTGSIWVTTGDDDKESKILQFSEENFEVQFSLEGSQTYRTVTLLFDEEYIYYGTDTPREKNFIYRFRRGSSQLEKLTETGGSVFFGTKVKNHLFFSTAWEPSEVNKEDKVELWSSKNGREWHNSITFQKDWWHNKLFRYGMIFFPDGPGDDEHLWFSTMGTKNDQIIYRMPITE